MRDKTARIGIAVFVFKEGKFLMGCRRGAHGEGTWSIPGGHLEFGESFEETARREVLEETGVQIRNVRFGAVTNDYFKKEHKHYVTVWMLSDWDSGQEKLVEPDKFVEMQWREFNNLPSPLFLPWNQLLRSQFIDQIKQEAQLEQAC
jgi:8-oxo-dGTP diphosphatase